MLGKELARMKQPASPVDPVDRVVARFSALTGAIGIALLGLLIVASVIARSIFGVSIEGALTISEYLLVAAVFLSLGYAQLLGRHVRMETVLSRLPPKLQCILNVSGLLLVIGFVSLLTWKIGQATYADWSNKVFDFGVPFPLPTWPPQFLAFIGCVLLLISLLTQVWRNMRGLLSGSKIVGLKTWNT